MIVLFELIGICTIWNLGVEIVLSDGMRLEGLRKWAEEKKSRWWEALIYCTWCRPSIHSIVGFLAAWGLGLIELLSWENLLLYPFVVCGSSAVSGIIWSAYKLIEIKALYYKHKEQNEFFDLKNRKEQYFKSKK